MVKVRVPASTSNLGSGFDCFGLALKLYLTVEMELIRHGLEVSVFGEGSSRIAIGKKNLIFKSVQRLYQEIGARPRGFRIRIDNAIPLFRGLGSSGAATIAGLVCASRLANANLDQRRLLSIANKIEGHPENASASLFGGFTINCVENGVVISKKVAVPENLTTVLLVPESAVSTHKARGVLPKAIPHEDAVFNLQRSALLAHAFVSGEYDSLREAMQDRLHQPFRKRLIPCFTEFETVGYQHDALGVCISGSGSAILGLTLADGSNLKKAWQEKAEELRFAARVLQLGVENSGVVEVMD